jgi:hypothetical protein
MSAQSTLFELPSPDARGAAEKQPSCPASLARDEAVARVEKNAAAGFMESAVAAIRKCAIAHATFTTDEVLPLITVETHEMRALGAAMSKAAKLGYIVATDRFKNTTRVSRHHAPVRVWASLIWGGSDYSTGRQ